MLTLDSPPERIWFVLVTAPLVLGTMPLVLELGSVVGGIALTPRMFDVAMFGLFLVAVGLSGVVGAVAAPFIHRRVDLSSRLGRTVGVDRTVARAATVVFGVFVVGMVANAASLFVLSGPDVVESAINVFLVPLTPWFLYPFLTPVEVSSPVGVGASVIIAGATGVWQAALGVAVGRVFERVTASA